MKSVVVLLTIVSLSLGAAACGGTSKGTSSATQALSNASQTPSNGTNSGTAGTTVSGATPTRPTHENDNDDHTNPPAPADDPNNGSARNYGHAASAADTRAITTLLERYYAIALAGEGVKACPMIDSGLVKAVPLDYGKLGPSYLRGGKTCAAVLSLLFQHEHQKLAAEVPQLKFLSMRLESNHGLVLLGFGSLPERLITVVHEGSVWKVAMLLDGEVV
jgi:hypothetical protein